ncbi:MAG: PAS domain S-box protein, partial [Planctomycetaceae bacterium]|nr:PAS domain S-box protein [Planctomycetaceae bacterium]
MPAFPARMRAKDGAIREVLLCSQVVVHDGKIHRGCYVAIDLTQQRKSENALEESEQRFRTLADTAPVLIWMSDLRKDAIYFNRSWQDFTGEPNEKLRGTGWLKCVHPDDRQLFLTIQDESFCKQTSFTTEFRLRRADGTFRYVLNSGSPRIKPDGTFQGFIGSCVDITDRKQSEEVRSQLAAIVDSSEDAIISKTLTGVILSWNAGAEKIFGYSAEEAVGQSITLIIPKELHDEENLCLEKIRQGERIEHFETVRVSKNGQRIDISLMISPVRDARGEIVAASAVSRDITAARRAEQEIRISEERFRELANNIDQFAWTCDETGNITWYNQRWYDYTGTTFEEMKGWGWMAVHHPGHVDRVVKRIRRAFETGEPWEDTFPLKGKNGEYRWFLSRAQPIQNNDGQVVRWFGTNTDITKELQAEEALRESEERFRTMANITPAILWTTKPDGTVTWLSDRWYEYTAMTRDDDLQRWYQVLHPDEVEQSLSIWNESLRNGTPYEIEYRYRRHDGEYRWFLARANPVRDADGRIVSWCGSSTEIQNQKQMEQAQRFLAEASKSLSALVDYKSTLQVVAQLSVPSFADWCAVDVLDEKGQPRQLAVAHVDPAKVPLVEELADRFRQSTEAPFGLLKAIHAGESDMSNLIPDDLLSRPSTDDRNRELIQTLSPCSYIRVPLQIQDRCLGILTFVTSESGRRYNRLDLEVAEDLANRVTIAIENARLYHEIQEGHRRKDEFLAMLAHELRNPLAPIRSGLDILAMKEGGDREIVRVMQDQVEHVVRLVDDLLDVSRIMRNRIELRKEPVLLGKLVQRSVEAARQQIDSLNQELVITQPDEPIWLEADPVRIIQVIENLLNNASKYTGERGRIELAVGKNSEEVTIRLTDTGIGIEPDLLPNVFDLFTQAQGSLDRAQGGLGIGLTLVHRLVTMHDGTVEASSAGPNLGSTFTVKLPIMKRGSQNAEEVVTNSTITQNRTILVVDDNVGAASMLSKLLGMLGNHRVKTAHDGVSALEAILESHPQIVLLDIGLPGMNGYEVAKAVRTRSEFDDVLLIALTGYGQKEDRLRSKKAGFDEHYVKPPSLEQMKEILQHPKLAREIQSPKPSAEWNEQQKRMQTLADFNPIGES